MDKSLNAAGYDLYEVTPKEWILHVKNGAIYSGEFKKVIKYAVVKLGFDIDELELAVKTMIDKGHNASHFGMNRGFIFSFTKEFDHVRRAS